jgi:hypothetical protein
MTRPSDFDPLPDPSPVRVTMGDVIEAGVESVPFLIALWVVTLIGLAAFNTWIGNWPA